ncbi:MAG TPA: hypothetical protein VG604_00340 [Candidatus Saccharimonadales bacterium]|nr:hypothetical protein [Candidatus Saccharimonadales bacterium]
MLSIEKYSALARHAVDETAADFEIGAKNNQGETMLVPVSYQIAEPGFRPFRAGKASGMELQKKFDNVVEQAAIQGVDLGLDSKESVRKLMIQEGWGIDCSNFAFRALSRVHKQLDLPAYITTVQRPASEIRDLYGVRPSWFAKDALGLHRPLTTNEAKMLTDSDWLSVDWIAKTFGKDPEFITGSEHIAGEQSAVKVPANEVLPGDVLALQKADGDTVSHVAVVEDVEHGAESVLVDFWHSWHTRDFSAGLLSGSVSVDLASGQTEWSHPGLADKTRYSGHFFARPILLKQLTDSIS